MLVKKDDQPPAHLRRQEMAFPKMPANPWQCIAHASQWVHKLTKLRRGIRLPTRYPSTSHPFPKFDDMASAADPNDLDIETATTVVGTDARLAYTAPISVQRDDIAGRLPQTILNLGMKLWRAKVENSSAVDTRLAHNTAASVTLPIIILCGQPDGPHIGTTRYSSLVRNRKYREQITTRTTKVPIQVSLDPQQSIQSQCRWTKDSDAVKPFRPHHPETQIWLRGEHRDPILRSLDNSLTAPSVQLTDGIVASSIVDQAVSDLVERACTYRQLVEGTSDFYQTGCQISDKDRKKIASVLYRGGSEVITANLICEVFPSPSRS